MQYVTEYDEKNMGGSRNSLGAGHSAGNAGNSCELDPAELKYQISFSESLIDYKARTNRCGIGVLLTDWL